MEQYDVGIIGSGPAGLAAAIEIEKNGLSQIIIERENRPGGILKQCIHDGFGLHRFKERLSGPEYAERFLTEVINKKIPIYKNTFVTEIKKDKDGFVLTLVNSDKSIFETHVKALILANGCRERTAKQVFIHGTRPSGVYTAGTAQYFVNISGYLPCKKCVILGSGDIGLIMARRLTLEGAEVCGVYEAKSMPSGLTRNIAQCLNDFDIPLHLSSTVTKIHGNERVEAVTVQKVDGHFNPIDGTEEVIECDGLILSVGLIPENELAKSLGVQMDYHTKGPIVNQRLMTNVKGVFSCGNALHVNDLVDYVSESAEIAARGAVKHIKKQDREEQINVLFDDSKFLYIVPQKINIKDLDEDIIFYFRSKEIVKDAVVKIKAGDVEIFKRKYPSIKPPEMECACLNIKDIDFSTENQITFEMKI